MITYEVTKPGYRIYRDEILWFVQEDEYATVYPGETMEERAQNHIVDLTKAFDDVESDIQDEII